MASKEGREWCLEERKVLYLNMIQLFYLSCRSPQPRRTMNYQRRGQRTTRGIVIWHLCLFRLGRSSRSTCTGKSIIIFYFFPPPPGRLDAQLSFLQLHRYSFQYGTCCCVRVDLDLHVCNTSASLESSTKARLPLIVSPLARRAFLSLESKEQAFFVMLLPFFVT